MIIIVSIWIFCITIRAEVLSGPDGNVVGEEAAREKSGALKAHDHPEDRTRKQQAGVEDDRQSRGMKDVHARFDGS